MSEIVNQVLVAGDIFMPKMYLNQPVFTYFACGPFQKTKKELKNLCRQAYYFQHGMAYGKLKDLARRTESDKVLKGKACEIASNLKYDGYQKVLASMVYKTFWYEI